MLQLFVPLVNGVWVYRHDGAVFVNALQSSFGTSQAIIKTILCNIQRDRMQVKLYLSIPIVCIFLFV